MTLVDAGWNAAVGTFRGPDPREMVESDLIICWGGNPASTQVNVMTHVQKARKKRDAKLVVVTSLALWGFGAVVLLIAEFSNPETLGSLGWADRVTGAVFGSASGRTAGIPTIAIADVRDITKLTYTG